MAEISPSASTRAKRIARAMNAAVARAPWTWPLMRGWMARFFDGAALDWDARTGAGSAAHLAPLAAATIRVSPAPERVLDVGTGTGEAALFLAREFPQARVRGIDISEEMVRIAQGKVGLDPEGRIAFRVADASTLPYEDGHFDLVAQLNTPPFFAELARVLRPGGHVIIAASWGAATPFYTPPGVLARGFERHGVTLVESASAGDGSYSLARKGSA